MARPASAVSGAPPSIGKEESEITKDIKWHNKQGQYGRQRNDPINPSCHKRQQLLPSLGGDGTHLFPHGLVHGIIGFPKFNLVAFDIENMNKTSIIKTLYAVADGDTVGLQLGDQIFQVYNAVIDHEVLLGRFEIFGFCVEWTPLRKTFFC